MRLLKYLALYSALCFILGAFTAICAFGGFWGSSFGMQHGFFYRDGWAGNLNVGAQATDPYTRAHIAKYGLLALNRYEAIYFSRITDSTGNRFEPHCRYRVSGGEIPARWWSVTLYAQDHFLARNEDARHSISKTDFTAPSTTWSAIIAPEAPWGAVPWISTKAAGEFKLILRLYNAATSILDDPEALRFPQIDKLSCTGADLREIS